MTDLSDLRLSDLKLSNLRPLLFWSERDRGRTPLPIRSSPPVRLDGVGDAGRKSSVVDVVDTRLKGSSTVAVSHQVGERGKVESPFRWRDGPLAHFGLVFLLNGF